MDKKVRMILWTQDFVYRLASYGSFHPMNFNDHHVSQWAQLGGAFFWRCIALPYIHIYIRDFYEEISHKP